jgi:predicted O-methyltransferase YrrM
MNPFYSGTRTIGVVTTPETLTAPQNSGGSPTTSRSAARLRWLRFLLTCKIPKVRLETMLRGANVSGVEIPFVSDHYETPSLYEQFVLATLVRVLKPHRCFEIGTSLGLTTRVLASNSSPDCRIDTLDVSSDARIGSAFRSTAAAAKIQQHVASSAAFSFEPYIGKIDLVFVDGSHEFKDVLRDTANAISMLSPTGVALWHDVAPDSPGVVKALRACADSKQIQRIKDTSLGLYTKPGSFGGPKNSGI